MRLMFMILTAASLYVAFLCFDTLPAGYRELLIVCWIAVALYCLFLFARPQGSGDVTSYDRQKDYRQQLNSIGRRGRRRDRFSPP